jgi:hypothetical protein
MLGPLCCRDGAVGGGEGSEGRRQRHMGGGRKC